MGAKIKEFHALIKKKLQAQGNKLSGRTCITVIWSGKVRFDPVGLV